MTNEELWKEVKKRVKKHHGKRCKDFCWWCMVCAAWLACDLLEETLVFGLVQKEKHYKKAKGPKRDKGKMLTKKQAGELWDWILRGGSRYDFEMANPRINPKATDAYFDRMREFLK